MTSYNYNRKIGESKDSKVAKNSIIILFLTFLLLTLLLTSIIIFNKFSYSSKNVKNIERNYEMKFVDINQKNKIAQNSSNTNYINNSSKEAINNQNNTLKTKNVSEKSSNTQTIEVKEAKTKNSSTFENVNNKKESFPNEQIQSKKLNNSTNIEKFKKVITSKNIRKYHSVLLKEFKNVKIISYRVKWGDTLWKIAKKFNTTAHTIYVLNAFNNPDLIFANTYIKVPVNFTLSKIKTQTILKNLLIKSENKTSFNNIKNYNQDNNNNKNLIVDFSFKDFLNNKEKRKLL